MPHPSAHAVTLVCHPEFPGKSVRGIAARVRSTPGGTLEVTYVLEGDLDRVRVPEPRPPRIASRLWEHTCCELFVARDGFPAYDEFNFSPSGEWAAYAFESYRQGAAVADDDLNPRIAVRRTAEKLELDAVIRLGRLSPLHAGAKLLLALSAVVEDEDGSLSYWALKHPPGRPDFHHTDAFALELER